MPIGSKFDNWIHESTTKEIKQKRRYDGFLYNFQERCKFDMVLKCNSSIFYIVIQTNYV